MEILDLRKCQHIKSLANCYHRTIHHIPMNQQLAAYEGRKEIFGT